MGIKGLLGNLPGGSDSECKEGFHHLSLKHKAVNLDAASLMCICAHHCQNEHNAENCCRPVKEFQEHVVCYAFVLKWDLVAMFDGRPPKEKADEHARREGGMSNTSTCIAMCAKACRYPQVPFVVAAEEADYQTAVLRNEENPVVVSGDSDLIAFGSLDATTVATGGWNFRMEKFRRITLDDDRKNSPNKETSVLYQACMKFGKIAFAIWAACMGCDLSIASSGMQNVGTILLNEALDASMHCNDGSLLNVHLLALQLSQGSRVTLLVEDIEAELNRIINWFGGGARCCDEQGNMCTDIGMEQTIFAKATAESVAHMNGNSDPKTGGAFNDSQLKQLLSHDTSNALHNSQKAGTFDRIELPSGRSNLGQCTALELRWMLVSRGGNSTDRSGKALSMPQMTKKLGCCELMEKEMPGMKTCCDRNSKTSGLFSAIDTNHGTKPLEIAKALLRQPVFDGSVLCSFFLSVKELIERDQFETDINRVALTAPVLPKEVIEGAFATAGFNTLSQKSLRTSFRRSSDAQLVYHAAALVCKDGVSVHHVLSKQRASCSKDEKTRRKTAPGEKPLPKECLAMMKFLVTPTTKTSHGHALGQITSLLQACCAQCTAGGGGTCIHVASACWCQHHVWAEGRAAAKPSTVDLCAFACRGTPFHHAVTEKADNLQVAKLPGSTEEADCRKKCGTKRNCTEGLSAKFSYHGWAKKSKTNHPLFFSKERPPVRDFFLALKKDNHVRGMKTPKPWDN